MKIYYIKSERHDTPLAQVRVEGDQVEFTFDTTNGKLPSMVGGRFDRLRQVTSTSSHLRLVEERDAKVGLLRYQLENGDVVELTSDGMTATLNGKFLNPRQKSALQQAIANGGVIIKQKADASKPIPIIPTPRGLYPQPKKSDLSPEMSQAMLKSMDAKRKKQYLDDNHNDSRIEAMDFGDDDPEFGRSLMYHLVYGKGKGE